jgi:hypothetical protein
MCFVCSCCLQAFFTKVPPTVTAHQLIQLFTACGDVVHVELFTPWPGAKISKGCGLVEFAQPEAALAAVASLHTAFTWPHSHSPLVVEWLDAKRQAANRASKLSKQGSGDSSSHMRRTAAAAAAESGATAYASHSAHLGSVSAQLGMQQQYATRSCPLPRVQAQQLPSGYMQPGWPAAAGGGQQQGVAYARAGLMPQLQQLPPQMAAPYAYQQQQQQGDMSATGSYWWPLPNANGAPAGYEHSGMLGMNVGSAMSTISTSSSLVAPISSADLSTGSLTCCSVGSPAMCIPGIDIIAQQQLCQPEALQPYSSSGCQSPIGLSDPTLSLSGAAGSLMMLQPMADDVSGQGMYVLGGSSGMMQVANAAGAGTYTSMPASAGSLALQQQQYRQLAGVQASSALYAASAGAAAGQPAKQQQWWAQQACSGPMQQQAAGDVVTGLLLSSQQLPVVAPLLGEVPTLTGAKAFMAASSAGSVQLVLAGQPAEVRSAHALIATLLRNSGLGEPLLQPAGMQR